MVTTSDLGLKLVILAFAFNVDLIFCSDGYEICDYAFQSSNNDTTTNISCWFGGRKEPCSSLNQALERLTESNDSIVYIGQGVYILNASM